MPKEVTLSELVSSAKQQPSNANSSEKRTAVAAEPEKQNPKPVNSRPVKSDMKKATPISTTDLGKGLAKTHPEAQQKIVEEDTPIVANAFEAMNKTLEEKKRFIQDEMMPVVMENAKEIAMEKELGESGEENGENVEITKPEDLFADDPTDDFAELSDDKDEGSVASAIPDISDARVTANHVSTPTPAPEVKQEAPKSNVTEFPKKENDTNTDSDNEPTLDDMLNDLGIDEEEDTSDLDEETAEELRDRFKESLRNVKVSRDDIDLSKFSISTKPISSAMALNNIGVTTKKRADHPLFYTGRNMTFEECSGPELDSLRKTINNSNGINSVIASLRFVYNHVVDANKKDFGSWCKSIRTEDVESLYFGMYKACYGDVNLIARADAQEGDKNACGKTSLVDTPVASMIKFADDECKQKFEDLMAMDTTDPDNKIKSNLMVVSDDLAISYSDPSVYSTFIQYASLKPEITDKYSDQLNTMAYINGFFRIDKVNSKLVPIQFREYPNNINKTVMSKLKTYIDLLKTLTNDQYNIMIGKLNNIIEDPKVTYIYPETTCPECGNKIPEESIGSMLQLFFTRAQLVQVKNM